MMSARLTGFVLLHSRLSARGEVCKGIARLVADDLLDNEYNLGAGWYGNGETNRGQFVPNPDAFAESNYEVRAGACIPSLYRSVECHQSKGKANCNEAHTCTELLDIKQRLLQGGYNCFGRHERTYWQQYYGEEACKASASCVPQSQAEAYQTPSRYLSPAGWKGAKISGDAFKAMGLDSNTDTLASSPIPRCKDGLSLFSSQGSVALDETIGEKLMYTGALRENLQRKGMCTDLSSDEGIDVRNAYMYLFDELRKLAGTIPDGGKNNWYMTHGFNLKGAFGEQVDEGYWMCLKPDPTLSYPRVNGSHQPEYEICPGAAGTTTASVDFSSTMQFGTDFLLSSESLALMEKCSELGANLPASIATLDTAAPLLVLTRDEVSSDRAWQKLLEIQNHALSFVPHGARIDSSVLHLGVFIHNNGGYRDPNPVHLPFRRILEDTITGTMADGTTSHERRFAIFSAILAAGDDADYDACNTTAEYSQHAQRIGDCYETFNQGGHWYWGGKDKAKVYDFARNVEQVYGSVPEWQGGRSWFVREYTSGFVGAAACLVAGDHIQMSELLTSMGCATEGIELCS